MKSSKNIILIDKTQTIKDVLERNQHYEPSITFTYLESFSQAIMLLRHSKSDLIICDYKVGSTYVTEFIKNLQYIFGADHPKIIVVASKSIYEIQEPLLKAGIKEFLERPFLPDELFMRIFKLLRNKNSPATPSQIILHDIRPVITLHNHEEALTKTEYYIIESILENDYHISYEHLLTQLTVKLNREISLNAIRVSMNRLRAKLKEAYKQDIIQTMHGYGYYLVINS